MRWTKRMRVADQAQTIEVLNRNWSLFDSYWFIFYKSNKIFEFFYKAFWCSKNAFSMARSRLTQGSSRTVPSFLLRLHIPSRSRMICSKISLHSEIVFDFWNFLRNLTSGLSFRTQRRNFPLRFRAKHTFAVSCFIFPARRLEWIKYLILYEKFFLKMLPETLTQIRDIFKRSFWNPLEVSETLWVAFIFQRKAARVDTWTRSNFFFEFLQLVVRFKPYVLKSTLTDTGENVQKWTRLFSTRRWVILVAWTRRKKRRK